MLSDLGEPENGAEEKEREGEREKGTTGDGMKEGEVGEEKMEEGGVVREEGGRGEGEGKEKGGEGVEAKGEGEKEVEEEKKENGVKHQKEKNVKNSEE